MIDSTLARFVIVGATNTVIGYLVILLGHFALGMVPHLANALGYAAGLATGYLFHARFTYPGHHAHTKSAPRFAVVAVACFILNLIVLEFGLAILTLSVPMAQALAVATYAIAFYLGTRSYVFRATFRPSTERNGEGT